MPLVHHRKTASIIPQNPNKGSNYASPFLYWCLLSPGSIFNILCYINYLHHHHLVILLYFWYQSGFCFCYPSRLPFFLLMSFSIQGKSYLIIFTFAEWKQLVLLNGWVIIICTEMCIKSKITRVEMMYALSSSIQSI